jgi:hypothetical protein
MSGNLIIDGRLPGASPAVQAVRKKRTKHRKLIDAGRIAHSSFLNFRL